MKALAVVVAVLIALWLVGRIGTQSVPPPRHGGSAQAIEVAAPAREASVNVVAQTQER